jgi:hypothetical protein
MQPRVHFGPSSWVLVIGSALTAAAAAVQAWTDAGGPGAEYLVTVSGVLAVVLGVLRAWQAQGMTAYGASEIITSDELLDDLPTEPTDVLLTE